MLCDHNRGQGHLRSLGKKRSSKKICDLELRYMFFWSDFRKEREKWPWNTFWSVKIGQFFFRKITIESRNDVKNACFWHVLCHISAIFEDIDLQLCAHIHQPLPSNTFTVFFENFNFEGENFEKGKKMLTILEIWQIFKILRIRDSSFVTLLILRHLK